jgi:hypothetical protein
MTRDQLKTLLLKAWREPAVIYLLISLVGVIGLAGVGFGPELMRWPVGILTLGLWAFLSFHRSQLRADRNNRRPDGRDEMLARRKRRELFDDPPATSEATTPPRKASDIVTR